MPVGFPSRDDAGIVVPLRSFTLGKARLADRLDTAARSELARAMADRVVDACGGRPVVVVSSAPEVVAWTAEHELDRIDDPGTLDGAADAGRGWVRAQRLRFVIVVHADLPLVTSLEGVVAELATPGVVAVPCHRGDGTPVLGLPSDVDFGFAYGPGSFARHRAEAQRLGLPFTALHDPTLAFDVDVPDDLDHLAKLTRSPAGRSS